MLGGTGSNVYTRALAREWSLAGHDVTVVCQERHAERYDLGGARVVVPELPDRLLPTFVLDRYEGLEARLLVDFSEAEREEKFSGHSLRAGLATSAAADERAVQKQLGHTSVEMTRTYQRNRDRFRVNLTKAAGL